MFDDSRTGRPRASLVEAWRDWATDVRGHAIPSGHFLAEEAPQETARALEDFFLE